jgi:N-acetylglucosaminyldiphosphoundecaprenol N-acetyl-beta-D-mannosaminyltransferase
VRCAGVPIVSCGPADAAARVVAAATEPPARGVDVHLCNAYTLAIADKDDAFRQMLGEAGINFPDGKAVVWANQLTHRRLGLAASRVYGPDLFLDVIEMGRTVGLRHFLLGSTQAVLADLNRELRRRFPDAAVVGSVSPPFRELTRDERIDLHVQLMGSGAQVVWVGLGTPKQDWEAARLASELPAVFVAVGAAFDFVAGHKRQAPKWLQDHGLEWAFRLASEPRRLWRRYLFGNARFVAAVVRRR